MKVLSFILLSFTIPSLSFRCSILASPRSKQVLAAKNRSTDRQKKKIADIISIEDIYSDAWKLESVVSCLQNGGMGVISTDTCYAFVTQINSQKGIDKIAELKEMKHQRKPLSIICKDFSMISKYTSDICDQKWAFKLLKCTLPGPYTYILPSSKEVSNIKYPE